MLKLVNLLSIKNYEKTTYLPTYLVFAILLLFGLVCSNSNKKEKEIQHPNDIVVVSEVISNTDEEDFSSLFNDKDEFDDESETFNFPNYDFNDEEYEEACTGSYEECSFAAEEDGEISYGLNLLLNPSFEDDLNSPPSQWNITSSGEFLAISSGEAFNGFNVAKFSSLTSVLSGREVNSNCFEIESTYGIHISAYVKTPNPVVNTKIGFKIYYFTDSFCTIPANTASHYQVSKSLTNRDTWESITYIREVDDLPLDATYATISIRAKYESQIGTSTDTIYFDGISVSLFGIGAGENMDLVSCIATEDPVTKNDITFELETGAICMTPAFTDLGDESILDTENNLFWTKCSMSDVSGVLLTGSECEIGTIGLYAWDNAKIACLELNTGEGFAGRINWHLPDIAQLQTLVDTGIFPALYSSVFPGSLIEENTGYWSSSTSSMGSDDSTFALGNEFSGGMLLEILKSLNMPARCVSE